MTAGRRAYRYQCTAQVSGACDRADRKPARETCRVCGSRLLVQTGVWAVFDWRADGRYRLDDAHGVYIVKSAAQRAADRLDRVVRFIVDGAK